VVVVGGGAAGLNAALVLAQAQRSVLVIETGENRNRSAQHLHGYLASDGLDPAVLLARGREEVAWVSQRDLVLGLRVVWGRG